jgi:ribosome recycling factor
MDLQAIYNIGIGIVLTGVGWFARELWAAVAELRRDIRQIEIDLPSNYLRKDEFREGMNEIKQLFQEVFRKIDDLKDKKADK